ncbi:Phosphocarrier protein HPr /phosphoenolpyruvate--protein phosphotransferase /PTS system IIA component, Glc family [Sphingomonas laterariae]|uniref:phosphoenolpyruvate--protein phosphotransferase n=1 Tax=Edaphosphingomonas laterariae TaxID=861865 RepID=A0A239EJQ9_9SPHN|nr:phosphoenolpyruvate--protein phosphotransferase [Sphingomonas laterariae]SNS44867.1 Phosphocarrier protein HPr /phosphoenolpyruvate--protein phosphotransferase /PTS system IIA component, Glc family [Sphingomonas laterariae]
MTSLRLSAPFAGWAMAIDAVPDPVFAERMMGDGIAIDPVDGTLRAPCDATVLMIAPTRHAVTLKLANGAELLIHIGLETVALAGDGFTTHVADGAVVKAGDPLISLDLDRVAERARSLITPIVVANDGYAVSVLARDKAVGIGDPLIEIQALAPVAAAAPVSEDSASCEVVIPLANGIHARPAARIAATLKPFAAEVRFAAHDKTANARSTVAMLGLGLRHGDTLLISARGEDARGAVTTVAALIESGMGEAGEPPAPAAIATTTGAATAAPGFAVGTTMPFVIADLAVAEAGGGVMAEAAALDTALAAVRAKLAEAETGKGAEIALAHQAITEDPDLIAGARARIALGKSAGFAWRAATRDQIATIEATGDALLIERAADLKDIERQVIAAISGAPAPAAPELADATVLIADELLPSQFLSLDPARLAAIVTARGGPTSHVAILAASAGVPMIVAAGPDVLAIAAGRTMIVDADAARFAVDPDAGTLAQARARVEQARAAHAAHIAAAGTDARTADGTRVEIFANLAIPEETDRAVAAGAEGCGLLRTEFLFLDRADPPSEDEQAAVYADIARRLDGRPLILRTLDIGGDKPVPYLPMPAEENPALGARGIRLSLARPALLKTQFRAMLKGVPAGQCRIMLPMIVDAAEFARARTIYDEAVAETGAQRAPLGVMIETPAAAMLADTLAAQADFLSLGTNDLTQYALAADRGNAATAAMIDGLHPAVLRLIAAAVAGARRHGRWIGSCGGMASEPLAAAILIGLGLDELSATPAAIPALKAAIRRLDIDHCRALAAQALDLGTAAEVRALAAQAIREAA